MSMNVSKQKREDLLAKIKAIRTYIATAPQDENTANLLAYLSDLEKDVGAKKYGLVFEEHREEIDEVLATHTPVLTEDGSLFIDNGGQMNFLIEGDNLASLQLLEKTHKGKIDLIYIDPPYNTGNKDFVYDDAFVDVTDTFRHSKWLSFIEARLRIAKKLLADNGAIFISIDDNEQAQIKLLCDDIFGSENFIANIIIENDSRARPYNSVATTHEYLLFYQRSEAFVARTLVDPNKKFKYYDEIGGFDLYELRNRNSDFNIGNRPNLYYPFYLDPTSEDENGLYQIALTPKEGWIEVYPQESQGIKTVWRWGKETASRNLNTVIFGKERKGGWQIVKKYREATYSLSSVWQGSEVTSDSGTLALKKYFDNKRIFGFPKPIGLIEKCISLCSAQEPIILDFFAGSGTTGHTVMKLNAEDGGTRRFILCTNNENNICREVTYERIKRVIDKEGYAASLKYFKVDYIPVSEHMYYEYADELLAHIRELVELENGINFTGNAEVGIVLTEDELAAFIQNGEAFAKCRKLYMGHDLLPDEEQEKILRSRGVEISIIPDYYYRDLQEG